MVKSIHIPNAPLEDADFICRLSIRLRDGRRIFAKTHEVAALKIRRHY